MTQADRDAYEHQPHTFWEEVAQSTWGAYVTDVERRALLAAHAMADGAGIGIDIGSEGGRWAHLFTDLGWQMICCDVNACLLKKCRERVPAAHTVCVGADEGIIPFRSDSASLLLCIEVAPVIESEWFVDEASRVLREGGLVVGVFWNALSLRGAFGRIKSTVNDTYRYYQVAYRQWRQTELGRRFRVLHEEGFCWFPFSRKSNSQIVPYVTRLEQWLGLRRMITFSPWVAFVAQNLPAA